MLKKLKQQLVQLHLELPKNNLVAWTGGNASARDPETGLIVIKARGIRYEDMQSEHMVIVDMDGKVVEGRYKPSSDVFSHVYIYRHRPDVGGVVHTHSRYATAFAAIGKPIPCVLTAIADEFGGEIPCGGFAIIVDEAIGTVVVESIGKSPAVLLKNDGVFTIGKDATAAVKAAVMTEDAAATVWLAMQIGKPGGIPLEGWLKDCEQRMDLSIPLGYKRREPRAGCCSEVVFQDEQRREMLTGEVMNQSKSGICVKVTQPPERWQTVT